MYYPALPEFTLMVTGDSSSPIAYEAMLRDLSFPVCACTHRLTALEIMRKSRPAIVVADGEMLGIYADDFVARIHARHPNVPVLVVCVENNVDSMVED